MSAAQRMDLIAQSRKLDMDGGQKSRVCLISTTQAYGHQNEAHFKNRLVPVVFCIDNTPVQSSYGHSPHPLVAMLKTLSRNPHKSQALDRHRNSSYGQA